MVWNDWELVHTGEGHVGWVCVAMQEAGVRSSSRLCALSNHDAWGRKGMRAPKTHIACGPVSIQVKTCACMCGRVLGACMCRGWTHLE